MEITNSETILLCFLILLHYHIVFIIVTVWQMLAHVKVLVIFKGQILANKIGIFFGSLLCLLFLAILDSCSNAEC